MFFILPAILFLGLLSLGVWWLCFRTVLRQERAVRDARRRDADFERLLAEDGRPLYCVACRETFRGPLEATGCPHCQVRAFVIPAFLSEEAQVREQAQKLSVAEPTPLQNRLP